jgi:ribosomal subunit interface protein
MRITVTGRHMPVPELAEEMLRAKVERLERVGHKLISLHAIFGREKYLYTVELTLAAKGMSLVARSRDPKDLLTAVEDALVKLQAQLQRREERRMERPRRRVLHRP